MNRIRSRCLCIFSLSLLSIQGGTGELPKISPTQPFTFVVLGDNRGDDSGQQPFAFKAVLDSVKAQAPVLILDSGDMIYGHTSNARRMREQWRIYRKAIAKIHIPIFHVPGNHDLWNEPSADFYRTLWGPTYYAFSFGNSRFIGLDTETITGQIEGEQFQWLQKQLIECSDTNIFLFMHRPLFPVDGGIGSSLDKYPDKRDRLHDLFVQHRNKIRGIFAGHEHLYNFRELDGVPYYISGGGGAPLYTAPELGGFHHFLAVSVAGTRIDTKVHRVPAWEVPLKKPRIVQPGQLLESWEQGLFCYAWDRSASLELTDIRATDGLRALRLNFWLDEFAWPVLVLPFAVSRDFSDVRAISVDVYLPPQMPGHFTVSTAIDGRDKHEAAPARLASGWNTITTELSDSWLPANERRTVQNLEWSLSSDKPHGTGYVIFDNLRIELAKISGAATELLESWERPLLWRVFDETVRAEIVRAEGANQQNGLLLHLDWPQCNRPIIFAELNPPWDLTRTKGLVLRAESRDALPVDLTVALVLKSKQAEFAAPTVPLKQGLSEVSFDFQQSWFPLKARTSVEQVALRLATTNTIGKADLLLRRLEASGSF